MHNLWASLLIAGSILSCFAFPDDDRECKRHHNEGRCVNVSGHYTCGCLFHEKPKLVSRRLGTSRGVVREGTEPLFLMKPNLI